MLFSLRLLLLLVLPLSAAETPQVIFAQPGASVTIPRKFDNKTQDKPYVNWYFQSKANALIGTNPHGYVKKESGTELTDRISFSGDFSLVIQPVLINDFGLFICEQHHYVNSMETQYQLYPVIMPTTLSVFAGDKLSLTCEVKPSPVHPTVKWIVPHGTNYHSSSSQNSYTIYVNNVSYKHRGVWICAVEHDGQKLHAITTVTIIDLSPSPPDPIYTSPHFSCFSMPCSFDSDVSWSVLNGRGVQGGSWSFSPFDPSKPSRTLLILNLTTPAWRVPREVDTFFEERVLKDHDLAVKSSNVSVQNRGSYTCSLQFKHGKTLSRKVQLEVLEVVSSDSNYSEGSTVNLTCTLGHPMPSGLEVRWIPPKTSTKNSLNLPKIPHISVPSVRVQDSGEWKCELRKNDTVLTSAVIMLEIAKDHVVVWIAGGITSGVFVFIIIIIIIICRRRQNMKNRKQKRRYCCCKNPQVKGFYKT